MRKSIDRSVMHSIKLNKHMWESRLFYQFSAPLITIYHGRVKQWDIVADQDTIGNKDSVAEKDTVTDEDTIGKWSVILENYRSLCHGHSDRSLPI